MDIISGDYTMTLNEVLSIARKAGFSVEDGEVFYGQSPDLLLLLSKFADAVSQYENTKVTENE
jgi:hypothetical protein